MLHNVLHTQEVIQLSSRLKRKTNQVDKLQHVLAENGLDSFFGGQQLSRTKRTQQNSGDLELSQMKENIIPSSDIVAPQERVD